jgi:hypothetical protein
MGSGVFTSHRSPRVERASAFSEKGPPDLTQRLETDIDVGPFLAFFIELRARKQAEARPFRPKKDLMFRASTYLLAWPNWIPIHSGLSTSGDSDRRDSSQFLLTAPRRRRPKIVGACFLWRARCP